VYTRRNQRERYTFSHAGATAVDKAFPPSLSVPSLSAASRLHAGNLERLRSAPVLVLATGGWAIHLSIEAFQALRNLDRKHPNRGTLESRLDRLPLSRYDHLDRLGATDKAECDELTEDYRALQYHCTMANYEAGGDHAWRLRSVAAVLSDVVILPKFLDENRLDALMSSFCRATRKTLRDSVWLAGGARVREEALGVLDGLGGSPGSK
jgi:hypothetical protein